MESLVERHSPLMKSTVYHIQVTCWDITVEEIINIDISEDTVISVLNSYKHIRAIITIGCSQITGNTAKGSTQA